MGEAKQPFGIGVSGSGREPRLERPTAPEHHPSNPQRIYRRLAAWGRLTA
jgi:hypothetical protein